MLTDALVLSIRKVAIMKPEVFMCFDSFFLADSFPTPPSIIGVPYFIPTQFCLVLHVNCPGTKHRPCGAVGALQRHPDGKCDPQPLETTNDINLKPVTASLSTQNFAFSFSAMLFPCSIDFGLLYGIVKKHAAPYARTSPQSWFPKTTPSSTPPLPEFFSPISSSLPNLLSPSYCSLHNHPSFTSINSPFSTA
ncbi:hypothetical protein Anapl_06956 [Anas platyrhynchos]|uniref:Uncharacterized protein n=1 Tax=Anas platyrhynchos TaxID=8839 RepID=R0LLT4_ANAPL|nr:hypothetical protein Anapl_06956 [Anas platyrhynchos]